MDPVDNRQLSLGNGLAQKRQRPITWTNIDQETFSNDICKLYFGRNSIEVCSRNYGWKQVSIYSGYGLVPTVPRASTWTNYGYIYWYTYSSQSSNMLTHWTPNTHEHRLPIPHWNAYHMIWKLYWLSNGGSTFTDLYIGDEALRI